MLKTADCRGRTGSDIFNAHSSGLAMADATKEIFYVDDSPDDRFFAEHSASKCAVPLRLKTYATGIAAILDMERRVARGESLPALLIADHYMPIMDGPELLQQIGGRDGMRSVRLVICSGGGDPVDVETALAAGAVAVLPKPVDFEICRKLIDEGPATST
jgi:CheY-like chemotaxis protein